MRWRGRTGIVWRLRYAAFKYWPFFASSLVMVVIGTLLYVSFLSYQERNQLAVLVRASEAQSEYNSRLLEDEKRATEQRAAAVDEAIRRIVADITAGDAEREERHQRDHEELVALLRSIAARSSPAGPAGARGPAGPAGRDGGRGSDGRSAPVMPPTTTTTMVTPCSEVLDLVCPGHVAQ